MNVQISKCGQLHANISVVLNCVIDLFPSITLHHFVLDVTLSGFFFLFFTV